jgi:hypothetical protein
MKIQASTLLAIYLRPFASAEIQLEMANFFEYDVFGFEDPTDEPSASPSDMPSLVPSDFPSVTPSLSPSNAPSVVAPLSPAAVENTETDIVLPDWTIVGSEDTDAPTLQATIDPSDYPSEQPSNLPSPTPSVASSTSTSQNPNFKRIGDNMETVIHKCTCQSNTQKAQNCYKSLQRAFFELDVQANLVTENDKQTWYRKANKAIRQKCVDEKTKYQNLFGYAYL